VTAINRTGISLAPERAKSMLHAIRNGTDGASRVDEGEASALRVAENRCAEPVGTMPPMVAPEKGTPALLLDRLGERLAFERSGARLYELLILKLEGGGAFPGGPSRDDLEHIRSEELAHFALISSVLGSCGGDPTAITPGANQGATESMGLVQVLSDPRISLAEGLHSVLVAELVDNAGWSMLVDLLEQAGMPEHAEACAEALKSEADHLAKVQSWVRAHAQQRLRA